MNLSLFTTAIRFPAEEPPFRLRPRLCGKIVGWRTSGRFRRSMVGLALMCSEAFSCDQRRVQGKGGRPSRQFANRSPWRALAGSDRRHERPDAYDFDHAFEVVGQNMEVHLGSDFVQSAGQEVRASPTRLESSEESRGGKK